jgi:uncharacterized protein (TIGR00369 family)
VAIQDRRRSVGARSGASGVGVVSIVGLLVAWAPDLGASAVSVQPVSRDRERREKRARAAVAAVPRGTPGPPRPPAVVVTGMTAALPTRADAFAPLPPSRAERWARFGRWDRAYFPSFVGLELEEARVDYARMRLRFRPELEQPAGVVHGGAVATLIDTVVVPAIGSAYDEFVPMLTLDLQIRYLAAAERTDLVAEGWITRRGRSVLFCQAEVRAASSGDVVAEGWMTYKVSPVPSGPPPSEEPS